MTGTKTGVVAERVAEVRRRIAAAGGDPERVTIVAVTKGFDATSVREALAAGLADVGENYAQELVAKAGDVHDPQVRWHFLGAVQRNKVAALAPYVALWQGVDRVTAGEEIARRAPGGRVLVQVDVDGGPGRNGCAPGDVDQLVTALRRLDLTVEGLMAVASPDIAVARRQFAEVARLRADLGLRELSMGMSGDLEAAVEAGSTMVRIGRALFGARPERREVRR